MKGERAVYVKGAVPGHTSHSTASGLQGRHLTSLFQRGREQVQSMTTVMSVCKTASIPTKQSHCTRGTLMRGVPRYERVTRGVSLYERDPDKESVTVREGHRYKGSVSHMSGLRAVISRKCDLGKGNTESLSRSTTSMVSTSKYGL